MKESSKQVDFSKDRPTVFLVVVNLGLMLATVLSVIIRLRPNDFKIPVQYIVYNGTVVQSGNWYSLYSWVLFILAGGAATIFLAHRLYKAHKYFSSVTLALYAVVALYAFFSVNALLSLVERV